MRGFCRGLMVAVAAVCGVGSSAVAQQAVGNASFEVDATYEVLPANGNWTAFFGGPPTAMLASIRDTTAPRTGSSALFVKVAVEGNSFAGMQQPIGGIQPGVSYTMSLWARSAGAVTNGVEYRIEWKNAGGGIIGDQFALTTRIDAQLTPTYQQFSLTATAPAGAASATLVMAVQSFVFDPLNPMFDTNVYFDDITFAANSLPTQGACCFSDGSCQVALSGACPSGSVEQAAGSTCSPNICPAPAAPGACCNTSTGACVLTLGATCTPLGGSFQGDGTSCTPNPCSVTACPADFNRSGTVSVQDIFDYLTAYFAGCP